MVDRAVADPRRSPLPSATPCGSRGDSASMATSVEDLGIVSHRCSGMMRERDHLPGGPLKEQLRLDVRRPDRPGDKPVGKLSPPSEPSWNAIPSHHLWTIATREFVTASRCKHLNAQGAARVYAD